MPLSLPTDPLRVVRADARWEVAAIPCQEAAGALKTPIYLDGLFLKTVTGAQLGSCV
jgi:hypothetical protein